MQLRKIENKLIRFSKRCWDLLSFSFLSALFHCFRTICSKILSNMVGDADDHWWLTQQQFALEDWGIDPEKKDIYLSVLRVVLCLRTFDLLNACGMPHAACACRFLWRCQNSESRMNPG